MITETQNEFKRTGNYVNDFDEFGNIVMVDKVENYFAVTLSPETYTLESVSNIYDISIKEFKDPVKPVNPQVNVLESEKQQLVTTIDNLNRQLSSVNISDSEKQSLIDASRNVIVQLRIKAGEGKLVSDFNTVFPYLPLKSEQSIQSDASSQGLGSGSTSTSTSTPTSNTSTTTNSNPALQGVIPSANQCPAQSDIQLVPETDILIKAPLPPPPPSLPPLPPAPPLPISQKAVVIATTPPPTVVALKQVEVQTVKCGGLVSNKGFNKGRYVIYVDLGTAIGDVTFNSDAVGVPDRFIVEWDNNVIVDTGYRGNAGLYSNALKKALQEAGLPDVTISGQGASTFTFQKTKATPSVATVTVLCPIEGTAWSFTMGCVVEKPLVIRKALNESNGTAYGDVGGGCPAAWQLIETKELGFVQAKYIREGMHLRDSEPNTWNRVNVAYLEIAPIYRIDIGGEIFDVDHSHKWYVGNEEWVKVTDIKAGDYVESSDKQKVIVNSVKLLGDGQYMHMNVDRERYIMGTNIIGHNATNNNRQNFLAKKF